MSAQIDLDEFVNGYLDAVLFTESVSGDDDTSLLSHGVTAPEGFDAAFIAETRDDCAAFIEANLDDLGEYLELLGDWHGGPDSFGRMSYSASECAGTDFWLSRNGHGAGYFDRGNQPTFDRLQDAARVYGEVYVYFEDGEVVS